MDRPSYEFEYSLPQAVYLFTSEGKNGRVGKRVQFDLIQDNMFNLGFGDWKEDECGFDDLVITNNGDMEKVLSTVIAIAVKFLSLNYGASLYLTGSTAARTRLYRIIISNNYHTISREYAVWGYWRGEWCTYEKNVDYEAFLVSELL
jgi:hypothetical protein